MLRQEHVSIIAINNNTNRRCNTFTPQIKGIHKPCIPGLFPITRIHLKVDQRVQRNNSPRIHLNIHWCTYECIPGKLFLFDLKHDPLLKALCIYNQG